MNSTKTLWINVLYLAITLIINTMGAIGLINGLSQKEVSDKYITLITPSPATFSIWSVIYSLLIISLIMMIVKRNDPYYRNVANQITVLFRISCLFNIAWIVSFSYVFIELSVLFIFAFVITLTLICQKLLNIQDKNRWLLPLSFGIYAGWLFIATVVNVAAALVKIKWNGFGIADHVWATIVLIFALLLVIGVVLKIRNAAFPLPVAWAYFGIYQFLAAPEGFQGEFPILQNTALIGAAVLIGVAAIQLYRNHFALLPKNVNQH